MRKLNLSIILVVMVATFSMMSGPVQAADPRLYMADFETGTLPARWTTGTNVPATWNPVNEIIEAPKPVLGGRYSLQQGFLAATDEYGANALTFKPPAGGTKYEIEGWVYVEESHDWGMVSTDVNIRFSDGRSLALSMSDSYSGVRSQSQVWKYNWNYGLSLGQWHRVKITYDALNHTMNAAIDQNIVAKNAPANMGAAVPVDMNIYAAGGYTGNGIVQYLDDVVVRAWGVTAVDDTAPVTTALLTGTPGDNGWYDSDVSVELKAADEEDGSGVALTEYSLDGVTWTPYSGPFMIVTEGINTIYYRSVDEAGNVEPTHQGTIKIDKTAPEAGITFDPSAKELAVTGLDNLGQAVAVTFTETHSKGNAKHGKKIRVYTLTDQAGHTLAVTVKVKIKGNQLKAKVTDVSYDGAQAIDVRYNKLRFRWAAHRDDSLIVLKQRIIVDELFNAKAKYLAKKDATELMIDRQGQTENLSLEGLSLITLGLNNGNFELRY